MKVGGREGSEGWMTPSFFGGEILYISYIKCSGKDVQKETF